MRNTNQRLVHAHATAGVVVAIKQAGTWGVFFRQVTRYKKQAWRDESRPYTHYTHRHRWQKITLTQRHRLEWRWQESATWRYRLGVTMAVPLPWYQVSAKLQNECFYALNGPGYTKNWVTLSVQKKQGWWGKPRVFLKQVYTKKQATWKASYHVGVVLSI